MKDFWAVLFLFGAGLLEAQSTIEIPAIDIPEVVVPTIVVPEVLLPDGTVFPRQVFPGQTFPAQHFAATTFAIEPAPVPRAVHLPDPNQARLEEYLAHTPWASRPMAVAFANADLDRSGRLSWNEVQTFQTWVYSASEGHALCLTRVGAATPPTFLRIPLWARRTVSGDLVTNGDYVPIDYDQVGGLSSAVTPGMRLGALYTPARAYHVPMTD